MTIVIILVIVALMIAVNALYVAGEFATVSARKSRVEQSAKEGNRLAKTLLPVLEDNHRLDNYIAASQVGITLSSIVLGIYGQNQITSLIAPLLAELPFINNEAVGAGIAAALVLIFLTTLQVILGELVPKSIAIQYPEAVAYATALPMRWSADIILRPLIILLNGSGALLLRLLGLSHEAGHRHVHSPEEIQLLIAQSHEGGLLDSEERELLNNAFRAVELTVTDIFVPRTRMFAADVAISAGEMMPLVVESGYTRTPVYEENIDHIVGFVHIKELFRLYHTNPQSNVQGIVRKLPYLPETMTVNEVWDTLDRERSYLAIVFDEYGGTAGMVTREDLIEAVFGEVQDEFDVEPPSISKIHDDQYLVRGDVLIVTLNDEFDLDLSTEYAHTIGGLIVHELSRLPNVGDEVTLNGATLRVQAVSERTVEQLQLTLPRTSEEQE